MVRNKLKDIKDSALDLFIDIGSTAAGDVAKDMLPGLIAEVAIDSGASLIPGVSGAVSGYKRARFERNIKRMVEEFNTNIQEIITNLESKTEEQKKQIDELFDYVLDFAIDEQQAEKIEYMVNGFVKITEHEKITEDFVLTYYDVLRELRMVDISVLRLMSQNHFYLDQSEGRETFEDVMERHGITYEQYESVRRNLHRIGLLTTRADVNVTKDLEQIHKTFKELYKYLDKLTDQKRRRPLPTLKEPKFKSEERFEVSKFGRDFYQFFIETRKKEQ